MTADHGPNASKNAAGSQPHRRQERPLRNIVSNPVGRTTRPSVMAQREGEKGSTRSVNEVKGKLRVSWYTKEARPPMLSSIDIDKIRSSEREKSIT